MVSRIPAAAVFAWAGEQRAQCPASVGRDGGRGGCVSPSRGRRAPGRAPRSLRRGGQMHAVLITFRSSAGPDDLAAPLIDHARALTRIPGLLATTWITEGATLGGFHVFASREAAERYLASARLASFTANPAFSDFHIRHFAVIEEVTRVTQAALFTST
jgi:Putative mono-oxygenase ydhR